LIPGKISRPKFDATGCQILRLKCTDSIYAGAVPQTVADLGGCGSTPLGVLQKNSWSTNFENSEDSRQYDYYYYQFYLAASSHEIFLRVGGREGMKGLEVLQRHQLPHPPCKNPGSATGPRPGWGELTALYRPLAVFKGAYF